MSAEYFRSLETQPASRFTIERLYSNLDTLSHKPPKGANKDTEEAYKFFAAAISLPGEKMSMYNIEGNETRKSQQMVITLHPEGFAERAHLSISEVEDIDGRYQNVIKDYNIFEDKVYKHTLIDEPTAVFDENFLGSAMENIDNQRKDEEQRFALMTESEVLELNAHLGALIEEE